MKPLSILLKTLSYGFIVFVTVSCCPKPINIVEHPSFDADGNNRDSLEHLVVSVPSSIKFFIEASGSMNGFFRSNLSTDFKKNVWSVFSNFEPLMENIYVFETQSQPPKALDLDTFKSYMNSGKFTSSASTEVPQMFQTVLNSIEKDEVAVLVSDMKYSPVGNKAMDVLLSQYATDIRNIVTKTNISLVIIAATSNFLDKKGDVSCPYSPYYYLIMGNSSNVAWLRNCIATILKDEGRYVGAVECGLDYKAPAFTLINVDNGFLLEGQPTIYSIDTEYNDTCTFDMDIDLSAYSWKLADEKLLKDSIVIKSTEGSTVKIDTIIYQIENHANNILKRKAVARVSVSVYDMYSKADVLEWFIKIPKVDVYKKFTDFWGAQSEDELDKTFSIESFIQGCCRGKANVYQEEPNRILISTTKSKK